MRCSSAKIETDNRRRRGGYAIPEVFFPCFLLFLKYFLVHLVVWGNFEMDNRKRRGGYAIPEVFFLAFFLFL